jgi:ATP-dependent DNA helicase DinG
VFTYRAFLFIYFLKRELTAAMDVFERFSNPVLTKMKSEINQAQGNEVFFSGIINEAGVVISVTAAARGNKSAVIVQPDEQRKASVLIHNHPSGYLIPSEADLIIADTAARNVQGFYIVNNDVSDVYVVVEPVRPVPVVHLVPSDAALYLSKNGAFARSNSFYEERTGQLRLTERIAEAFNTDSIAVFEAGTGIGKSFAYLIPAILWAVKNNERVLLSTGTINLQQQLMEKDIPAAGKILGASFKSILMKGRQNYVCQRRLEEACRDRDLFSEDTVVLDQIAAWAKSSKTGSRSDLSFVPSESVWTRVNSESDACLGMHCSFRESCFVMKVRKEAADAQVIVVNHHLFFADIESRVHSVGYDDTAVLPPYRRVVLDEAHGIENAATSFFSEYLNRFKLIKQLNLLFRQRRGVRAGFLYSVAALSSEVCHTEEIESEIAIIKESMQFLESAGLDLIQNNYSYRICEANKNSAEHLFDAFGKLQEHIAKTVGAVREIIETIPEDDRACPVVWDTKAVLRRLDALCCIGKNFQEWSEHPDSVFWMQKLMYRSGSGRDTESQVYVQFVQTPLDIAPLMNEGVFEPLRTVVCTSATLTISNSFNFWERRTGVSFVDKNRIITERIQSPFPYETNLLFTVPNDIPFPDSMDFHSFVEDSVVRLILAAGGRTLVLFTSYDALRSCCETARLRLLSTGITILKQGDDDRFRLLAAFKEDVSSVLFATDSFWEGVDVPGDSLSQVIITKLPFGVPSDPVFAARSEAVQNRGGSPFMELSVPDAVIKFRQGVGRLIRRKDDRGVVAVLDRRIMEKQYGKIFLDSIPQSRRLYVSSSVMEAAVRDFLN